MDPFSTPGAFSWAELLTADPEAAARFYGTLLGWEFDTVPDGEASYRVARLDDEAVAGILKAGPEMAGVPKGWGCYITVDDVDDTAERCLMLGGKVLLAPTDLGSVGRFAVLQDSQGAVFSVIAYDQPA
ncbi:MAG: VOC family protein [Leptothrix sp. (in: b-proteobacteria)]